MSNAEGLTATIDDHMGEIVLDRPARKNAVTLAMWLHMADLIAELASRSDVRVIVLRGAGNDFSAGADIAEFDTERRDATSARNYEAANSRAFAAIRNAEVPVIAAIRGICFGGGFGLAAAADLRLATPDARFAVPAARLGLAYPSDAMADITNSVGPQMARYLTLTGATIGAEQALACGFLLEVVDAEHFDARVDEIAGMIATNAPLSIKASRLAIGAALSGEAHLAEYAKQAGDATFDSSDYAEGRAAFREKRKPVFSGM
jgi:enoyl-CoA hydratase/carnithine racemase